MKKLRIRLIFIETFGFFLTARWVMSSSGFSTLQQKSLQQKSQLPTPTSPTGTSPTPMRIWTMRMSEGCLMVHVVCGK